MKAIVKAAMLFAVALLAFSACLKEQTSLSIEDIPGKAKVMGKLMIDEGQTYEGNKFVQLKKPAANMELVLKVKNSSLDPDGTAAGWTDYPVTTNEEGLFEVEIPAVDDGVQYKVVAASVFGKRYFIADEVISNGQILTKEVDCVYDYDSGVKTVTPGKTDVISAVYTYKTFETGISFTQYADMKVAVGFGKPKYVKDPDEDFSVTGKGEHKGDVVAGAGVDIIVSVDYKDAGVDDETYKFGATTGEDGVAVLSIPCISKKTLADASISVKVLDCAGKNDFVYYEKVSEWRDGEHSYRVGSQSIAAGTYTYSVSSSTTLNKSAFEFAVPTVKVMMTVTPSKIFGKDKGIVTEVDDDSSNNEYYEEASRVYYEDVAWYYSSAWTTNSKFFDVLDK